MNDDCDTLRRQIQDLQLYINGRHDRWSQLETQLADRDSALLRLEGMLKERDTAIARRDEEKARLAAKVFELERQSTALASRLAERESACKELNAEIDRGAAALEELFTAKTALVKRVNELTAQLVSSEETLDRQSRHVQRLISDLNDMHKSAADMRAQIETLEGRAAELAAAAPAAAQTAARRLIVTIGGRDFNYPIVGNVMTIGRDPTSDIRVAGSFVSRLHAKIRTDDGETIIEDAGSRNGVLVNAQRVRRRVLRDGDVVSIGGELDLRFVEGAR